MTERNVTMRIIKYPTVFLHCDNIEQQPMIQLMARTAASIISVNHPLSDPKEKSALSRHQGLTALKNNLVAECDLLRFRLERSLYVKYQQQFQEQLKLQKKEAVESVKLSELWHRALVYQELDPNVLQQLGVPSSSLVALAKHFADLHMDIMNESLRCRRDIQSVQGMLAREFVREWAAQLRAKKIVTRNCKIAEYIFDNVDDFATAEIGNPIYGKYVSFIDVICETIHKCKDSGKDSGKHRTEEEKRKAVEHRISRWLTEKGKVGRPKGRAK